MGPCEEVGRRTVGTVPTRQPSLRHQLQVRGPPKRPQVWRCTGRACGARRERRRPWPQLVPGKGEDQHRPGRRCAGPVRGPGHGASLPRGVACSLRHRRVTHGCPRPGELPGPLGAAFPQGSTARCPSRPRDEHYSLQRTDGHRTALAPLVACPVARAPSAVGGARRRVRGARHRRRLPPRDRSGHGGPDVRGPARALTRSAR